MMGFHSCIPCEEVIQSAKARGKVGGDCTGDDDHYEPNMPFGQVYAMMLRNHILLSYQHGQHTGAALCNATVFLGISSTI